MLAVTIPYTCTRDKLGYSGYSKGLSKNTVTQGINPYTHCQYVQIHISYNKYASHCYWFHQNIMSGKNTVIAYIPRPHTNGGQ